MAGDDLTGITLEALESGRFVHMGKIQHKPNLSHGVDQVKTSSGQRSRLTRATAILISLPSKTNDPRASLPPFRQFIKVNDTFRAFHERYEANWFQLVTSLLPQCRMSMELRQSR